MPTNPAVVNLSSLNGSNGFQINGEAADDLSGGSVASAGDVNGDGFADLIIGAHGADPNGSGSGASYVVFGKASGFAANVNLSTLNGTNGFQINGEAVSDNSGRSVASAGDVNGDGFADLIIGALGADPNGSSSGASYVVFGKVSGFAANVNLSTLNGTNGFQINGEAAIDFSGRSVASAGDVNGDGFADLIIGAHSADPNGSKSGASYVVFGKASGFAANLNLSTLNGTNGFQINGEVAFDYSGGSVASAGDVNGDGLADLIIGVQSADPNGSASGASYVVFGKASGFAANLNLSTLNGSNGFQINGEVASDASGGSVASAGDVNGDGFADLIIGAFSADPNGSSSGASYVVFGKASGFAANVNLSTLDGSTGFQINGEAAYDHSGASVASAGDVNGDGFADLIIGANGADPNGSSSGASYVVFGKASGFAADLELSTLNGTNGFQINGEAASDFSGGSVAAAGDVNGDGFADLIIGASTADPNGDNSGSSYVVFGRATAAVSRTGTSGVDKLFGGEFNDTLNGLGAADRLEGRNGNDIYFANLTTDLVVETNANLTIGGNDLVNFVGTTGTFLLAANVERLTLGGAAAINGTGNSLANIITGNSAANILNGGVDTLADSLRGGLGHDTYVLGASNDVVVEALNAGTDTVTTTISRTSLAANVENLTLLTGAANGTGNSLANVITGNSAVNALNGGVGTDTLIGGLGIDTLTGGDTLQDKFQFNALNEGGDIIADFDAADLIVLKASAFLGLTSANKATNFVVQANNHNAVDANDRLIFNQADDTLWYDSNGSTAGGTIIKIADLNIAFALSAADILMV